jgi:hypothetical protein
LLFKRKKKLESHGTAAFIHFGAEATKEIEGKNHGIITSTSGTEMVLPN